MVRVVKIVLIILIFFSLILSYGYWHAKTHGAIDISVYDASVNSQLVLMKDMEIVLKNNESKILATGKSDS